MMSPMTTRQLDVGAQTNRDDHAVNHGDDGQGENKRHQTLSSDFLTTSSTDNDDDNVTNVGSRRLKRQQTQFQVTE
jgi:hypothetical protein